ncbi:aminopeptidase [Reticulomyxa filosa]|uniref:Aminopeptidase n=1 Tax=Reticulomyxa filosa TaxID=46433 RepID=X6MG11_RETFI|nr:aminopeptidase [Reticulomyxa filosa]|eukprot:ETO12621.1 aminopeptidase [Reticulomyxa filosa]
MDMGAEYMGYATDVTCSYPVSGEFTKDQKAVHNAVLEAQRAVLTHMKAGVEWKDMHRLAETLIVKHLYRMGVLRCDVAKHGVKQSKEEKEEEDAVVRHLMQQHVASLFMPHGLGHLLGMNVHDVGGFTSKHPREKDLGLCWLRTTRTLQEGMFITVEPGLYFNESWIKQLLSSQPQMNEYVNFDVLKRFFGTGGCRLEDDVLVTKDGIENLTLCPRTCEDIEEVIRIARKSD